MTFDNFLSAFLYLKERLSEPGTHRSLMLVCMAIGVHANEELLQSVLLLLTIIFGFVGALLKEFTK